ncbi:MAG TPA: hypothetical protein VF730_06430 [Terracidiphilus sp.]
MPDFAGGSVTAQDLLIASLLGVVAGALMCLLLRKSWGVGVALLDAVFGPVIAVSIAYAVIELNKYGSIYLSPESVILPVAVGTVALRHLVRLAL